MNTRLAALLLLTTTLSAACDGEAVESPDDTPVFVEPTVTTEIVEDQDLSDAWIFSDEVIHDRADALRRVGERAPA
ncbi:MAG: hypothetical protein IPI35_22195 [Deltaproteobacteria bacterium]|nr:hypothetical protein [Deltaproteobacteria bacterium]